jgi:hypothetical protein
MQAKVIDQVTPINRLPKTELTTKDLSSETKATKITTGAKTDSKFSVVILLAIVVIIGLISLALLAYKNSNQL